MAHHPHHDTAPTEAGTPSGVPHLRLMVEHDGLLHLAVDHLEQYDLTKPLARTSVIGDILTTISDIRRALP